MEEIDYHWKCLLLGYDIFSQPNALVYHKGGQTLPYGSSEKIFLNHRNSMILFLTNNFNLSYSNIMKRIILEKLTVLFYIMKLNLNGGYAVIKANIWLLLNIKYLRKRKKQFNELYGSDIIISSDLMKKFSVIKKYYLHQKKKFSNLN